MDSEKCPRLLIHISPVSLNTAPREKARLEEGTNFHEWLPENED